ncbi:MAG: DUF4743 domain-containing protein [Aquabacterium sp.]
MTRTRPGQWHALRVCRERPEPRLPFRIWDGQRNHRCGSVARAHVPALSRWPDALQVDGHGVSLRLPAAERDDFLALLNRKLRDEGLIVAWRDETYPLVSLDTRDRLALIERAASRFWGTLTFGAHCNGYVAGPDGRPSAVWIARRSPHKATDPGLLDNLIGGGVPHDQSPRDAVLREGWEEAGLRPEQMAGIRPGRIALVQRDIPEGTMLERISIYDLELPGGLRPANQDGEVAEMTLYPVAQALALAASAEMTVDAGIVMLDFALRHRLLDEDVLDDMTDRCADLWVGDAE